MQSLRRVALRAASSAAVAPKAHTASVATRFAASTSSKVVAIPAVRFFNSSAIRLNEDKPAVENSAEAETVNAAVDAAEESTSTTAKAGSAEQGQGMSGTSGTSGYSDQDFKPEPNGVYGIFVWNIPYRSTEREMYDTFCRFGQVHSLNIGRDARGLSRGFAFVYYQTVDEAKKALDGADGAFWQGRRIGAKPKSPSDGGASGSRQGTAVQNRARSAPTSSLYIGNIPYEATDNELNSIFSGLDHILDVRVAIDKATGWPRGFAHADFADVESATKALEKLSTVSIQGRLLRLDYSETKKQQSFASSGEQPGPNDKVLG